MRRLKKQVLYGLMLIVFVFGGYFTILNFNNVQASSYTYNEDFSATTYFDSANSTATWNTTVPHVRLPFLGWGYADGGTVGNQNISNDSNWSYQVDFKLDVADRPHLVWTQDNATNSEIFYTHWDGSNWVRADGTVGFDNISDSADGMPGLDLQWSEGARLVLDNFNQPHIIWRETPVGGNADIFYTKWNGVVWTTATGAPGSENISNTSPQISLNPQILINSSNNPCVAWSDALGGPFHDIAYTEWTGVAWSGKLVAPIDNVSGSANQSETVQFVLDSMDNPRFVWRENIGALGEVYYAQWTPWIVSYTQADGVTPAPENISLTANDSVEPDFVLDGFDQPHVAWVDYTAGNEEIFYTKWNGLAWTQADGVTLGYENVSSTIAGSVSPVLLVKNTNTPAISWIENIDVAYSQWSIGSATWTKADGTTVGTDIIDSGGNDVGVQMALDSSQFPNLAWSGAGVPGLDFDMYFSKWNGSNWVKGDNISPGIENISQNIGVSSVDWAGDYKYNTFAIDSTDRPHLAWTDDELGTNEVYYAQYIDDKYRSSATVQSLTLDVSPDIITQALWLPATTTIIPPNTDIDFYLSNNGGQTWHLIDVYDQLRFPAIASDLRWKAELTTSDPTTTPQITHFDFSYLDNQYPNAPVLALPLDNEINVSLNPVFRFSTIDPDGNDLTYVLELSDSVSFENTRRVFSQSQSAIGWSQSNPYASGAFASFTFPIFDSLTSNKTYYWRTKAMDEFGLVSEYSAVRSFTTSTAQPFVDRFNVNDYIDWSASTAELRKRNSSVVMLPATNSFNPPSATIGSGNSYDIGTFDADNDHDLDLVIRNDGQDYYYRNDGGGVFTEIASFGTGTGEGALDIVDVDNDGDLDVLIANEIGTNDVYFNDGTGNFPVSSNEFGFGATNIMAGDIDNDNDFDVVVTYYGAENKLYLNDGNGQFNLAVPNPFAGVFDNSRSLDMVDIDNDGDLDIFIGNYTGNSYLYRNEGFLNFTQIIKFGAITGNLLGLSHADIDNDGDQDMLVSATGASLFINDGHGNFSASNPFGLCNPYTLSAIDIDRDGDEDVLCGAQAGGDHYLFRNHSGGVSFSAENVFNSGTGRGIVAGDVDNDTNPDVMIIDAFGQNHLFMNIGAGSFARSTLIPGKMSVLAIFDSDNDGDMDFYVKDDTGVVAAELWVNDGTQNYTQVTAFGAQNTMKALPVDVDDDGFLDIVEATFSGPNNLYLNNGNNTFSLVPNAFGSDNTESWDVVAVDVENDGDQDIVFSVNGGINQLWLNDGVGVFSAVVTPFDAVPDNTKWFDAGDVDNDGDVDFVFPVSGGPSRLFINIAPLVFVGYDAFVSDLHTITLGDLDNDGDLDAVVADDDISANDNQLWINDGTGTFSFYKQIASIGTQDISLADLDNDNDLDIVLANTAPIGGDQNVVCLNHGDLSFICSATWFFVSDPSNSVVLGDYDSDNDLDIFFDNDTSVHDNHAYSQHQSFDTGSIYTIQSNAVDNTNDIIGSATLDLIGYNPISTSRTLKLSPGGFSWLSQPSGTSTKLNSVSFDNINDGYVCGDNGKVFLTANGGAGWSDISPTGESDNLNFIIGGPGFLFVLGDNGTGLFTGDNGVTWDPLALGTAENMNGFAAEGGRVFGMGDNGTIIYSDDSGATWFTQISGTTENLNAGADTGVGTVYVVGDNGTILKTTDNGNSWNPLVSGTTEDLNGIVCDTTVFCLAVGDNGTILKTTNGINWVAKIANTSGHLTAIYDTTSTAYYVSSSGDTILESLDSGDTWTSDITGNNVNLNALDARITLSGLVTVGDHGKILKQAIDTFEGPIVSGVKYTFNSGNNLKWQSQLSTTDQKQSPVISGVSLTYAHKPDRPINNTPVDGTTSIDPAGVITLTASIYNDTDANAHVSSRWQVDNTPDFSSPEFDSGDDAGNLTTINIPAGTLPGGTNYYWRVKYNDSTGDSSYYSVQTTFSTSGSPTNGRRDTGETPSTDTVPVAPIIGEPEALSSSSLRWHFTDSDDQETGFELQDSQHNTLVKVNQTNLTYLDEAGLSTNNQYHGRQVYAFNSKGYSAPSALAVAIYTLAQTPSISLVNVLNSSSISFDLDVKDNPAYTEFAIKESISGLWLQANHKLGSTPVWQTYQDWQDGSITIQGLTPQTTYSPQVKGRNGDGVETPLSDGVAITTPAPGLPAIVLSKTVGINAPLASSGGVWWGRPVLAKDGQSVIVGTLPLFSYVFNFLIIIALILLLISVTLVIYNPNERFSKKAKYYLHVVFKDWTFKKPKAIYQLLAPQQKAEGPEYNRHVLYYRVVAHSALSLIILLLLKIILVVVLAIMVYGVGSFSAVANDDGLPVKNNDLLTYQVSYSNTGEAVATGVQLTDVVPAYSQYQPGSLIVNGVTKTDVLDSDGGSYSAGTINFVIGTVAQGAKGTVSFQVKVNGDSGQSVQNIANGMFNESAGTISSNQTSNRIQSEEPIPEPEPEPESEPIVPIDIPAPGEEPSPGDQPSPGEEPISGEQPVSGEDSVPGEQPSFGEEPEPLPEAEPSIDDQVAIIKEHLDEKPGFSMRLSLLLERAVLQTQKAYGAFIDAIATINQATLDNSTIEHINEIIDLPLISAVALANLAIVSVATVNLAAGATTGLGLLVFLQFFITQPFMFFAKRKREQWGIVYDSITKKPIDLAIVRLFNHQTHGLIATRVTDQSGRFSIITEPGEYYLVATKPEYKFPSEIMAGKSQDEVYIGLYHGSPIRVNEKMVLNFNLPLDPDHAERSWSQEIRRKSWRDFQYVISLIGPIASLVSFAIQPRLWIFIILLVQMFLLYVFIKMSMPKKVKNWGVVSDEVSGSPIKNVVTRLFDTKYNKLLDTQITDSKGRYGFLVTRNVYQMTGEKPIYQKYTSGLISVQKPEGGLINKNFSLQPQNKK